MPGKALQRSQPLPRSDLGRDKKMNVVGHDDPRMQLITPKALAVQESLKHQIGYLRPAEKYWSASVTVEQFVHGCEGSTVFHPLRREDPVCRQAAVETKSNKQRLSHRDRKSVV